MSVKPPSATFIIIGGGAAGFFGAIACAQALPQAKVILLEKNRQLLAKVRISGGGRCNVTHACFEPRLLSQYYPRGGKALIGPFHIFQPKDTIEWFSSRGVPLKTEEDGRMFPCTDSSQTIIDCLMDEANRSGVEILTEASVENIERIDAGFKVHTVQGSYECNSLLIASGSSRQSHAWVEALGHTIAPLVPSLFTFNTPSSPLLDISGVAVESVHLKISGTQLEQTGPLLLTHWGFSGPAVLKLSAWGARILHEKNYSAELSINWLPAYKQDHLYEQLVQCRTQNAKRLIGTDSPFLLPKSLWKKLLLQAGINEEAPWASLSNRQLLDFAQLLRSNKYQIEGKTTFKQEFVTCGGVNLDEINFKTMESRLCKGLYFAGEVLDIDGITGGFNFQSAWTTGWLAGHAMGLCSPF